MSATLAALERNAKALVDLTSSVVDENTKLSHENKKLSDQLGDALDAIYALKVTIRERDELISELRQVRRDGR